MWWSVFLPTYNGMSLLWLQQFNTPDEVIAMDANNTGAGGVLQNTKYFRFSFPRSWQQVNIAYLEMWAIIVALRAWGADLTGKKLVMKCDNLSVVQVLNSGKSRDLFLQAALREVMYILAGS